MFQELKVKLKNLKIKLKRLKRSDYLFLPLIWITPSWISPNIISYLRSAMFLPIIILMNANFFKTTGVLFITAAILDGLDGALARYRGQTSAFGAILDPTADKILNASVFLGFLKYIHAMTYKWLMAPILVIDGLLFTIAICKYLIKDYLPTIPKTSWLYETINVPLILENVQVDATGANWAGKTKMVLQVVTLSALLFFDPKTSTKIHEYWTFLPHIRLLEISYGPMVLCSIFGALSLYGHLKVVHLK